LKCTIRKEYICVLEREKVEKFIESTPLERHQILLKTTELRERHFEKETLENWKRFQVIEKTDKFSASIFAPPPKRSMR